MQIFEIHLLTFTIVYSPSAKYKVAIVHIRDARNGDLCQVVQYCGHMDALAFGLVTQVEVGWLAQD